uniref:Uncharacterized protein n=1 Tax=Timema douglasi TaxID=61478 RepID=A0A7R8VUP8_TIMDO|nr:unnamed protein product [Timema douglasi]
MYSSPTASLVLTDSSRLTSDSQHLAISCELSVSPKGAMGATVATFNSPITPEGRLDSRKKQTNKQHVLCARSLRRIGVQSLLIFADKEEDESEQCLRNTEEAGQECQCDLPPRMDTQQLKASRRGFNDLGQQIKKMNNSLQQAFQTGSRETHVARAIIICGLCADLYNEPTHRGLTLGVCVRCGHTGPHDAGGPR